MSYILLTIFTTILVKQRYQSISIVNAIQKLPSSARLSSEPQGGSPFFWTKQPDVTKKRWANFSISGQEKCSLCVYIREIKFNLHETTSLQLLNRSLMKWNRNDGLRRAITKIFMWKQQSPNQIGTHLTSRRFKYVIDSFSLIDVYVRDSLWLQSC